MAPQHYNTHMLALANRRYISTIGKFIRIQRAQCSHTQRQIRQLLYIVVHPPLEVVSQLNDNTYRIDSRPLVFCVFKTIHQVAVRQCGSLLSKANLIDKRASYNFIKTISKSFIN